MSRWILTPVDDAPARAAKRRLTTEVRALIEKVARAVPGEHLDALATEVAAVTGRIGDTFERGAAEADPLDARLLERSPLCGVANPLAPPISVWLDGDRVVGSATYGFAYEGPAGCVHGGYVAAAFDDLLGSAQTLSGNAGFTGTLTVKMIKPTPLLRRIDYLAWLEGVEGRKIRVRGTASAGGELLAEADGIFIHPRDGMENELMARMSRLAPPTPD